MSKVINKYNVEPKIIKLERFNDERGSLNVLEFSKYIKMPIKRLFFTYNIPDNATRGQHAHKNLYELIISIQGSVEIELSNENNKKTFILDSNEIALLIPPLIWTVQRKHTANNILVALCSTNYDKNDYINNHFDYLNYLKK